MLFRSRYRRRSGAPLPYAGLLEAGSLAALLLFIWFAEDNQLLPLIALVSAAVVFIFAHLSGPLSQVLLRREWLWLGAISYSVYMTHVLVLARIADLFLLASRYTRVPLARYQWQDGIPIKAIDLPLLPALAVQLGMIAACLLAAHWTYRLIEEPARQWSRRLAARSL